MTMLLRPSRLYTLLQVAQENGSKVGCDPRADLPKSLKLWSLPSTTSSALAEEEGQEEEAEVKGVIHHVFLSALMFSCRRVSSEHLTHSIDGEAKAGGNSNLPRHS